MRRKRQRAVPFLEDTLSDDVFRELQQRLDAYSLGFPATDSGIELDILRHLFSEQNAAMFLTMTRMLETPESVAQRLDRPADEVAAHLEDMARKGLLFRLEKGGAVRYGAVPFVHGLLEFQITRLDSKLAEMVDRYLNEGFGDAVVQSADYFLRTIPVQKSIDVTHHVASYEDACEILNSRGLIVVTDCICRKRQSLADQGCGKPLEACFMFGSMAQYYLDHDMGRQVTPEEATEIVSEAQKAGLVTQPATAQNPAGLCNCCGDCCGVLRSLNIHPRPAEMVFSNHYAVVDADVCSGCEACVERCQMGAISLGGNDVSVVDLDRCIGCGLCVVSCPTEAARLSPKSADEWRTPPANSREQMMAMAQKRGIQFR